ncbi:MAG: ABC transporter substrate-binding protein, partial [Acetanaerobacterium sp.]
PVMGAFIEQIQYAVARGPHPKWPEISATLQDAFQQTLMGTQTPEEASKRAAEKIAAINASVK